MYCIHTCRLIVTICTDGESCTDNVLELEISPFKPKPGLQVLRNGRIMSCALHANSFEYATMCTVHLCIII